MGTNIFSIGVSGLNASQVALSVVGQNISNANTPGYNRQTFDQAARVPQDQGFGFIGKGVDVTQVMRSYDKYLDGQVLNAQANSNFNSSQLGLLNQIDSMVGDATISLTPAIQDFFSALQAVAKAPSDGSIPSRTNVVSMAQALVGKFRTLDNRLQEIHDGINTNINSTVTSINTLAQKIAGLNNQISALAGNNQQKQPNDLMDQRDNAMQELNKLVSAKSLLQPDGTYSVFIGSGQTLVLGNNAMSLATQPNATNPRDLQVVYPNPNGTVTVMSNSLINGGNLAGLLNVRDNTLLQTEQQLGNIAIDLTTAFNYQQKQGLDLDGNPGQAMFTDLTSFAGRPENAIASMATLLSDPRRVAAASDMVVPSGTVTNGNGVTVSSIYPSLPGSYGWSSTGAPPVYTAPDPTKHPSQGFTSITVSAASTTSITARIVGGPADTPPTPGGTSYNVVVDPNVQNGYKLVDAAGKDLGVGFMMSGQLQASMSFTAVPNTAATYGKGDNSNLAQMLKLQTAKVVDNTRNGSTGALQSFATAYSSTVSYVGNQTSSVQLAGSSADTDLKQTVLARSNVSGVNLDQEAADLIRYQQAYQASSKVIQIAQTLFSQLLQL